MRLSVEHTSVYEDIKLKYMWREDNCDLEVFLILKMFLTAIQKMEHVFFFVLFYKEDRSVGACLQVC